MSMLQALSLLGVGAGGYAEGKRIAAEEARKQAAEDFAATQRAQTIADQARANQERDELAKAAAPVQPAPDTIQMADGSTAQNTVPDPSTDSIDVGQPGTAPAQPAPPTMQAIAAAKAANTPDAVRERQLEVMQKYDPAKAASMAAANASIKNTTMDLAAKQFALDMSKAVATGGWDGLTQFTDKVGPPDMLHKAVVSSDGKTVNINRVMPDGTLQPGPFQFDNSPQGMAEAQMLLNQHTPPATIAEYAEKKAKDQAEAQHQSGMLKVVQHNADTQEQWRKDQADTNRLKAENAASGRKADHFDAKEWDAVRKVEPALVSFGDPESGKAVESPELRLTFRNELSAAQARGDMSPNEAADYARTVVVALRNRASDIVAAARQADPKSTLTEPQAVQQILRAAAAAKSGPGKPAAATAPANTWPANAPPGSTTRPGAGPMASAAAAQAPSTDIPDPPPQFRQVGLRNVPNPAFTDWQAQYGDAYAKKQAAAAADADRAAAAARTYNPYIQNRVQ